eukprot:SAG11_NODE_34436_length_272_cov_0.589595_1_plen_41_part_10
MPSKITGVAGPRGWALQGALADCTSALADVVRWEAVAAARI